MPQRPQGTSAPNTVQLRLNANKALAERMEARMTELDMAYGAEFRRLGTVAATAGKTYLCLKGQRG